jgi:four helix bundle protein
VPSSKQEEEKKKMESKKPPFELEERTYEFALRVRLFLKQRAWHRVSWSDVAQLLRSSGSVSANYVESQEAVSEDDFTYRIRICRKETRESGIWLRLLGDTNEFNRDELQEHENLLKETTELARIFTAILRKRLTTP